MSECSGVLGEGLGLRLAEIVCAPSGFSSLEGANRSGETMAIRTNTHYWMFLLSFTALSCSTDCEKHQQAEVTADTDATSLSDSRVTDAGKNRDSRADSESMSDARDVSPEDGMAGCPPSRTFCKSSYVCADGQSKVAYRSGSDAFEKPGRSLDRGPVTRLDLTNRHSSLPKNARYFGAPSRLEPSDTVRELYASYGRDVKIHFVTMHPRDRYGDSSLKVTVLLNYRPTHEVIYEHLDARRSRVVESHVGTDAEFSIDGAVEIVDVTIPSEAFDGPGRYDIGFGWGADGPVDYPAGWRRIYVYYGGCSPLAHPCAEKSKHSKMNDDERTIAQKYLVGGYLYPAGKHSDRGPLEKIEVSGGSEVTLRYSIQPGEYTTSYVVAPFINDRPTKMRRLFYITPSPPGLYVSARREITLQIPNRPGKYEVDLGMWDAPFLDYRESTRWEIEPAGRNYATNSVTYVVKE